jgi:hypothetical protein
MTITNAIAGIRRRRSGTGSPFSPDHRRKETAAPTLVFGTPRRAKGGINSTLARTTPFDPIIRDLVISEPISATLGIGTDRPKHAV